MTPVTVYNYETSTIHFFAEVERILTDNESGFFLILTSDDETVLAYDSDVDLVFENCEGMEDKTTKPMEERAAHFEE